MTVLPKLIDHWRSKNLHLLAAETRANVCEAFASIRSRATSDVVAMYAALGGMEEMDDEYWRLWPLQEVKAENAEHIHGGVLFSDYLMSCWCYRLRPNADDTSAVLVDHFDGKPQIVAQTLEQFLEAYAANPQLLFDARSLSVAKVNDA